MVNIPGLDSLNIGGMVVNIMYWVGYLLFICLIIGVLIAAYFILGYRYKVTILERRGKGKVTKEGEEEEHSIGKITKDRAKEIKVKGVNKWVFLFSRKVIQPPDFKCIYPGNKVFLYRAGLDDFYPMEFTCKTGSITPMPQDIKRWQSMELQQAAEDYTKKGFMDQYGNVIVMMGTVLCCLILVGVTVYYTYEHANGVTSSLGGLTDAIKNNNLIAGI